MDISWDHLTETDWAARVEYAPLQQSWAYGQTMAKLGAGVRRGLIRDSGTEVGVAQVLQRRGLQMLPRGPVWFGPKDHCAIALRRMARTIGLTIATPEHPVSGSGFVPLMTPRHQAIWNITPDPAVLRAQLSRDWRTRLHQAEVAGAFPKQAGQSALKCLLRNEAVQRQQRGYRALPAGFAECWPGPRMLWEWRQGDQQQAAMLFLIHGQAATYHIAWGNELARKAEMHRLMLWQAMLALRDLGVRQLDLGDVSDQAPGLARFKQGTGAEVRKLGATVWVLPG